MKYDVFISYSRKDFDEVSVLIETIRAEIPDLSIWFDITGIESGDEFEEKIISAIDNSSYVLFALSENSIGSKWTKDEVMYARNTDKKVIPVLLKGAQMKGWFLFKFGRVDCIDSTNDLQMEKLLQNLSDWTGKNRTSETAAESVVQSKPESLCPCGSGRLFKDCHGLEDDEHDEEARSEDAGGKDFVLKVKGIEYPMVFVEGGTFNMGTNRKSVCDYNRCYPVHQVTISNYHIGKYEVTQDLWEAVMESNPSYFKGKRRPVEQVSWYDCLEFISKLNDLTGKKFKLPTEAQWEFAARGGKKTKGFNFPGCDSVKNVAWYRGNSGKWYKGKSGKETHDVGLKNPNELGLYDMGGNVWEWCNDFYNNYPSSSQTNPTGESDNIRYSHVPCRCCRGGAWDDWAVGCDVCYRGLNRPEIRSYHIGLRLCL